MAIPKMFNRQILWAPGGSNVWVDPRTNNLLKLRWLLCDLGLKSMRDSTQQEFNAFADRYLASELDIELRQIQESFIGCIDSEATRRELEYRIKQCIHKHEQMGRVSVRFDSLV